MNTGDLHTELQEYLDRFVIPERRDYAESWVEYLQGGPEPLESGEEWTLKVRSKVQRLFGKSPAPSHDDAGASAKQAVYDRLRSFAGIPLQPLGRGSKEHADLFEALAETMGVEKGSKQKVAESIVTLYGGEWDAACFSRGGTISTTGLVRIEEAIARSQQSSQADGKIAIRLDPGEAQQLVLLLERAQEGGRLSKPQLVSALDTIRAAYESSRYNGSSSV